MTQDQDSEIRELRRLIETARNSGKWLSAQYGNHTFSPDQLEAHINNGKFLWGPGNWVLSSPCDCLHMAVLQAVPLNTAAADANQRVLEILSEMARFKTYFEVNEKKM